MEYYRHIYYIKSILYDHMRSIYGNSKANYLVAGDYNCLGWVWRRRTRRSKDYRVFDEKPNKKVSSRKVTLISDGLFKMELD